MVDSDDSDYENQKALWPGPLPVIDFRRIEEEREDALERQARRRAIEEKSLIYQFRKYLRSEAFRQSIVVEDIRDEVKEYFSRRHNFRYVKTMISTRADSSGATLFAEMDRRTGKEKRRLMTKFSAGRVRGRNEAKWMNLLSGLQHIVDPVYIDDALLSPSERAARNANADQSVLGNLTNAFSQLTIWPLPKPPSRPILIHEYLESGDLYNLRERLEDLEMLPPNRFLWRLLLCLLRGCAGMAYYPYISPGTREAVDKGQDPIHLEHRQLDTPHVLIGPLIEDDSEHDLAPLFKLCGFSQAEIRNPLPEGPSKGRTRLQRGIAANLRAVGRIVQTMACPYSDNIDEDNGLLTLKDQRYEYRSSSRGVNVVTNAHEDFIDGPHVSRGLKFIVCQILAYKVTDQPSLEELLERVASVVAAPAERNFAVVPDDETNASIAKFVQHVIFNANTHTVTWYN